MTGHPTGAPALRTLIGDYLATRRALGFTLDGAGQAIQFHAEGARQQGIGLGRTTIICRRPELRVRIYEVAWSASTAAVAG